MSEAPKISVGVWLQALTIGLLGTGGAIGKGAYEDLRTELVQQRIETAELRKTLEVWSEQAASQSAAIAANRAKLDSVESRLVRLEVTWDLAKKGGVR